MFDTIILLTSAAIQPIFASVLAAHNPDLTIFPVETRAELDAVPPAALARARLIAFVTSVIVPGRVLDRLGFGAYNFHPGPPAYPGWAPAHFALYERAAEFGATAHVMAERVDEGPIVAVEMFRIPKCVSPASLEGMAYARLAYLFWNLAKPLAACREPLPRLKLQWSGRKHTRRDYASLCDIPLNIERQELDHRIEVFGADPNFGSCRTFIPAA